MNIWNLGRLTILGLLLLGMASIFSALAAANTVPVSGKLDTTVVLTVQQLQPQDCNALTLTSYAIAPGGSFTNNGASALIIGTAGFDDIRGGGGNDCIVGGSGGDALRGGTGGDVCFGDSATTFKSCSNPTYTTLRP
jgi:Ca2+-binding RTX toxin-like protein